VSGRAAYASIDRRQVDWVNELARRIPRADLETTARVLDEMSRRLASADDPAGTHAIPR
jgi:hypothetical protein